MITAYINGSEIIPYESVEYIEQHPDHKGCIVHMAESKKEHPMLPEQVDDFIVGYKQFLELKETIMGIVDDSSEDQPQGPRRKT